MQSPFDALLNLPGVSVEGYSLVEGYICIHLAILEPGIKCPRCGLQTKELHQVRPTLVRDLPSFGKPVYLKVPKRQFYCRSCQRYVTERLEFVKLRARHTKRYEQNIYQRVLNSNLEQVSREEGISSEEAEKIFNSVSQQHKKKDWGEVEKLCIDEFSRRKGHKNFVTVVSDFDRGALIEVIDSHKQQDIIESLNQQPFEVRAMVKEVSVDMWAGFRKVVKEVFPHAAVVIDRFHVMKLINQRLNKIRRQAGVTTKGSRYLLLKNNVDLSEKELQQLVEVLQESPCLRIAYQMKEEFRSIYETSQTVVSGLHRMQQWLVHAQLFYGKTAVTLQEHLPEICNYFISHTTSGVMEGINNKIKLILRQGYGLTKFETLRSRSLGSFG